MSKNHDEKKKIKIIYLKKQKKTLTTYPLPLTIYDLPLNFYHP